MEDSRSGPRRLGVALLAAGAAAGLVVGLTGCGSGSGSGGDSGGGGGGRGGSIRIGIKFDQPGLGFQQGSLYTGMDVDVARYVAAKLGYRDDQIQWVQTPTAQRESLIQTGQVTLVVATYSITDERRKKVDFAGPYFIAGQDLLVRTSDTSITGVDTLAGKKLCSVAGSTSAQTIQEKVPGVNLEELASDSDCVTAVASGAVDAMTTDNTILAGYAAQPKYEGRLRVVGRPFSQERYGIGLKKGDTALCTKVTTAISEMITDGSWQRFVVDNLGQAGFKPGPGNPPTPQPCS